MRGDKWLTSFSSFNLLKHVISLHIVNNWGILVLNIEERGVWLNHFWISLTRVIIRTTSWLAIAIVRIPLLVWYALLTMRNSILYQCTHFIWVIESMSNYGFHLLMVVPIDGHLVWISLKTLRMLIVWRTIQLLPSYYWTIKLMLHNALLESHHWKSLMNCIS